MTEVQGRRGKWILCVGPELENLQSTFTVSINSQTLRYYSNQYLTVFLLSAWYCSSCSTHYLIELSLQHCGLDIITSILSQLEKLRHREIK